MKIPKKLKIGGVVYTIVYKDIEGICGRLCRENNTIILSPKVTKQQHGITLLHEAIHALNGEVSEIMVDSLAVGLHQVLTDNKL